ncbi:hypothetical protein TL16_g02053 [Triparma laevis f. inornata]|uniref:G-protein coupled receptors family 3 profile domain-containing protein n=1 Tax=Triparma laevis f. inornata TaxID=1714386 RepID=A0A9W6ZN68_9STRA|nr:hypothetical protein TL16_g02053 [Triparma laevis f. inornata]
MKSTIAFALSALTWGSTFADTSILRMGLLHPAYRTSSGAYDGGGHNRLAGSVMAINEINSMNGVDGDLLPGTTIEFEWLDSGRSGATSLKRAYEHATTSFSNAGAQVIVGPASSGPSMMASYALQTFTDADGYGIPQMSYSASSPDLSVTGEFPQFFRTVASDGFQGKAIAGLLKDDLGYTDVCIINSLDSYSATGAAAFGTAAVDKDMNVINQVTVDFNPDDDQADERVEQIRVSACRVVFLMTQSDAAGVVLRMAAHKGMFGPTSEYLWVLPDAISGSMVSVKAITDNAGALSDGTVIPAIADLAVASTGSIGSIPLAPKDGDSFYDAWLVRYRAQTSTAGNCVDAGDGPVNGVDSCACSATADSAGTKMWQLDHDGDPSTADICRGFDFASSDHSPNSYGFYAYDAVYAFARAAHNLVVAGATEFTNKAITDELYALSFAGLTGTVDFEDTGDREIGTGFTIQNFDGTSIDGDGVVTMGSWDAAGFVFNSGQSTSTFTWATTDGTKPVNVVLPLCTSDGIAATVAPCENDGTRAVTWAIKTDADGNNICLGGEASQIPNLATSVNCKHIPSGGGVGSLAIILAIVGAGICFGWAGWIFMHWKNKVIKISQPSFCVAFTVSAGLMCLSTVFFVGEDTNGSCVLRPFLFNIFFDFMFGSLFLKTFRVYKIFGNKSLSKVKISTFDICRNYGSIVAVDIAILVVWMVTEGMEAEEVTMNDLAPYGSYTAISCNKYETLTTFFKILLVGGGVYLSWVTRNVPDKFAESKWIGASIYQVFVLGVVGLLVKWSSPESGETILLVQSIAVPVACVATTCCIFGPKVLMIKYPQNYESALVTSANTGTSNTSSGSSGLADSERQDLLDTIAALEKELKESKGE